METLSGPRQPPADLGSSPAPPAKIIPWVNYAKGFGICLVVVGHTLQGLANVIFEPTPFTQALDQWIYAFHMPLFFFLSGLFIERSVAKPFSTFLGNRLRTLVYPYFLWSFLQELLRAAAGIRDEPITDIWRITYAPVMQFWFLYVLFLVSLAYVVLRKLTMPIATIVLMSTLLFISGYANLQLGPWTVVYLVRLNAVYFVLGALAQTIHFPQRIEKLSLVQLQIVTGVGFGAIALVVAAGQAESAYWVPILALVGIAASFTLSRWLELTGGFKAIQTWGILSLEIFLVHTIISAAIRVLLQKLFGIDSPMIHVAMGIVAGIYGPILLCQICQKLNFEYLFRWPAPALKPS